MDSVLFMVCVFACVYVCLFGWLGVIKALRP